MGFFNTLQEIKCGIEDQIAIEDMSGTHSYDEFYKDLGTCAKYFANQSEQRIAFVAGTSYEWICFCYGALIAGKDVIAIDSLLPRTDIATLLDYSDAEVYYTDAEDKKLINAIDAVKHIDYRMMELDAVNEDDTSDFVQKKEGDIIFFTSGTSGKAKGVVLPFGAVYRNAQRLSEHVAPGIDGKGYMPMPTGHIYANSMILTFLYQKRTICLGNPRRMTRELEYFKPSVLAIVSSMAEYLMQESEVAENIKVITVAGAKCENRLEYIAKEHGILLQNLYGTSETAGAIAMNKMGYSVDHMLPLRDIEVSLSDEDEIIISNKDVMKEYYKKPEETSKALRDGRIFIGDRGEYHEDGTFMPLGRMQDMIAMKNGNKLYCNEIDEELSQFEGVSEACVLYVADSIVAVVVTDCEDELEINRQLKEYNKQQPYYRKIDSLWIRKQPLPRTSIGKLKRGKVEEEYLNK